MVGRAFRDRLAVDRADVLDRVIDGADAGRQEQPFGRVDARLRIEDHGARHHQRMAVALLDVPRGVGAAGRRGELAGRQVSSGSRSSAPRRVDFAGAAPCRRQRSRRGNCRAATASVTPLPRQSATILAASVTEPPPRVTSRSARPRAPHSPLHHIDARGVRADFRADPGHAVAEGLAEPVDAVGRAGERAAGENKHRAGVEPIDLLRERLGKGLAEDDAFHLRKAIAPLNMRDPHPPRCARHPLPQWRERA